MNPFVRFEKGTSLGKYRLESVLGRGRSAAVFKAIDTETGIWVSLKVLDPFLVQDAVSVERFKREAIALRSLSHPNIISVHSVFNWEDSHCIVMEYFPGENLRSHLDKVGRLTVAQFRPIAGQLIEAIEACHKKMILHRDLKPQNVLVNERGELKLVDFGISKVNSMSDLTKTGTFLGTPEYMAPEMFASSLSDGRVDVYGLGAIFFEMLAGKSPFFGLSIQHVMAKQAAGAIPYLREAFPEIPNWLECVIRKCLSAKPEHRYQTVYELGLDLEKGENALAVVEKDRDRVHCWECQGELLTGLPYCHLCGMWLDTLNEVGPYSIIVNKTPDSFNLTQHAERQLALKLRSGWKQKLKKRPFVLVGGLDEKIAKVFYNSLAAFPVEAQVARNLPSEMKLPWWLILLDAVFIAPVFTRFFPSMDLFGSVFAAIGYLVASQIPVLYLYARQTSPVAGIKPRLGAASEFQSVFKDWYDKLMRIGSARARHLAALQLKTFASICQEPEFESQKETIARALDQSMKSAVTLSEWEKFLSGTSLNDIKELEREMDAKIRLCSEQTQLESLVRRRAELKMEFENYRVIQAKYNELYLSLINFHGFLKKIENEAVSQASEWVAILNELEADVRQAA